MRTMYYPFILLVVGVSVAYGGPTDELSLLISCGDYRYEKSLNRELLDDKDLLCRQIFETYDQIREEHNGKKRELWRLQLTDEQNGKFIFDLHFHGDTKPTKRSLYEFVLHIDTAEQVSSPELRILIDRVTLHNFLWDRTGFIKDLLDKANFLVARRLGYGRATAATDIEKLVVIDSWRYEIFRFGRKVALYSGTKEEINGSPRS